MISDWRCLARPEPPHQSKLAWKDHAFLPQLHRLGLAGLSQPHCSALEELSTAEPWYLFLLSLEEICFTTGMCFCVEHVFRVCFDTAIKEFDLIRAPRS